MNGMKTSIPYSIEVRERLTHALTEWDRKQSTKRGYNPYALAQYLMAVDRVTNAMNCGVSVREALLDNFCDRLLNLCINTLNLDRATDAECRGAR